MNMRTFSAQTGLSAYTIRYYEKLGLLPGIQRNASGHRAFTTQDLEWVRFIVRLKDTGMSLDDILTYSRLRALGSTTLASRQKMLEQQSRMNSCTWSLWKQRSNTTNHSNLLDLELTPRCMLAPHIP